MKFHAMRSRARQSGVTMVELLVTMFIVGFLLSMGVSSYKYVTKTNRAAGEINALLGDMQFARYEAVKEGFSVTVCPVTTGSPNTCSGSASWETGWIVQSSVSGTATVLRRQLPFTSFKSTDTLTSTSTASVVFNREGFATGLGASGLVFSLHDSASTVSYTRCLVIGMSGVMQTGLASATYSSAVSILGQTCS